MTDPTKALADAARRSVIATTRLRDDWSEAEGAAKNTLWRETHEASKVLFDALAAYDAAQATKAFGVPCHLCERMMLDGTDGHGLGECVPVCPTCDGSGTATEPVPPNDTHADTREGWEWRDEVFRLRKDKEALLQAAKAVVEVCMPGSLGVRKRRLDQLNAEVERASKGGSHPVSQGAVDIAAERARHLAKWPSEHDDEHTDGAIAVNAAGLAVMGTGCVVRGSPINDGWGLQARHATDRRQQLVIAGALIAAEIDRLDRASKGGAA